MLFVQKIILIRRGYYYFIEKLKGDVKGERERECTYLKFELEEVIKGKCSLYYRLNII